MPSTPIKKVVFSSDVECSPEVSSPPSHRVREPKSILKNLADAQSPNTTMEMLQRDLTLADSWPSGFVLQLSPGSTAIRQVIDGCVRALQYPDFPRNYEVLATLNDIVKSTKDSTKGIFTKDQALSLTKAIDADLMKTAEQLRSGSNAFRIRMSIQAVKLLTYIMARYEVRGAASILRRVSSMLLSANLSKGLAAALLQLIKEEQNNLSSSAVESITDSILQMKHFVSTTIVTEKLMTLKRFIAQYPAVMSKISYLWMSYVLCCILNTDVPSYERIVTACNYVLNEFAHNAESKDVVFRLLNETLDDNASSIRSQSMEELTPQTKIVDAMTMTLIYMINRGWPRHAFDIWTQLTYMVGFQLTNQVELENWTGMRQWIKVFDEGMKLGGDSAVMALESWKCIIYNYQKSSRWNSSMKREMFEKKRAIFLYPFTMVPETSSRQIVDEYLVLYHRLAKFLCSIVTHSTSSKRGVSSNWVVDTLLSLFYSVFLKRPEFFSTGQRMLLDLLRFKDQNKLESSEACFRKTNLEGWSLSCLPKQFLISNYTSFYAVVQSLLLKESVPISCKVVTFNQLTFALSDCTKNAIISSDAADGFSNLFSTYLRQVMDAHNKGQAEKPQIQYLCDVVLRSKSVFGTRIFTNQDFSLLGAFIVQWYGPRGIHDMLAILKPFPEMMTLFYGLTMLDDPDINDAVLLELVHSDIKLSKLLSDDETCKEVVEKLHILTSNAELMKPKVKEEFINATSLEQLQLLMSLLPSRVSHVFLPLYLSPYCRLASQTEMESNQELLDNFLQMANLTELDALTKELPTDKLPYSWYKAILAKALSCEPAPSTKSKNIRAWLTKSVSYLEDKYHSDCMPFYELTKKTSYEVTLVKIALAQAHEVEKAKRSKKEEAERRMREQVRKRIAHGHKDVAGVTEVESSELPDTQEVENEQEEAEKQVDRSEEKPSQEKASQDVQVGNSGSGSSGSSNDAKNDKENVEPVDSTSSSDSNGSSKSVQAITEEQNEGILDDSLDENSVQSMIMAQSTAATGLDRPSADLDDSQEEPSGDANESQEDSSISACSKRVHEDDERPRKKAKKGVSLLESAMEDLLEEPSQLQGLDKNRQRLLEDNLLELLVRLRKI